MENVMIDVAQSYIVSAYAVSGLTLAALMGWSLVRFTSSKKRLAQLEEERQHDA